MVRLALVRRSGTMPEEDPLKGLIALQVILEAELVLFVSELEEVQKFGRGFMDGERRALVVINQNRDAAIGVESQEP